MKKIVWFCIFVLSLASMGLAQTNSTETLIITTYFPSPYGVYRNLKLNPTDSAPNVPSRGVMFYNNTSDSIFYYNNTGWVNLAGGGGGGGNDTYWNGTGVGNIYNNNTGFVGIGTQAPQAPLTVKMSNTDPANATVVSLIRHVNGTSPNQYLFFNLYPPNAWAPYLNSTSVIYSPRDPTENLELTVVNQTRSIRFNVGNFSDPFSEVMRLVNPNGTGFTSDPPDVRVGIGNSTPLFPLQVDTKRDDKSVLGIRATSFGLKTGIFSIAPWYEWVDLTYGCYLQGGGWVNDPYEYPAGQPQHHYAKFIISSSQGVFWYAGDTTTGNNYIPYTGPPLNPNGGWNKAFEKQIWQADGTLVAGVCPVSSRKLKENFAGIKPDDILGKIDRLEVSRWNYKAEAKSVTHIGPIAEDFNRLFKTGSQEDQLHLIDSAGVSLAGVKALSGKINAQEQEIEELEREVQGLRAQLGKYSVKGRK
ncbi:MAG: tail fiber domain-containing protein [Candidatus Omnitrophica bacterium]|nr:tail fiber domain-containing protein [Candidatus Omnitrophota bacterium]